MYSSNWNWVGAQWWKFDFHAHTMASSDYGKGANQTVLKQRSSREWLLNYMRAEIDCVVVADHNIGEAIDNLKEEYKKLKVENISGFRELSIFPGIEITAQSEIHILGIFPLDKTSTDINSVVDRCQYRGTKGSSDNCTEMTPVEVIKEIVRSGGIPIPAHIDLDKGLFRQLSGHTLNQILDCEQLIAAEKFDKNYLLPDAYKQKKLNWSFVLGSDQHHPTGSASNRYPGSHFTWVKMSKPSLDGLRLALLDGSLSLKRSDECPDNPNKHSALAIESATVKDTKYMGRGEEMTFRFNPWLNCIIGGRGTGKSTLIEFLRLIFRRTDDIPKSLEDDLSKYQDISTGRMDDKLLLNESDMSSLYKKDSTCFKIQWDAKGGKPPILQMPEGKAGTGEIKQRFPVRIFSQKEIFELAKKPQALLSVIDDSQDVNYREWKLKRDELLAKYLSLTAQRRELENRFKGNPALSGELEDVKRKLKIFEVSGHSAILKEFQSTQHMKRSIVQWEESWTGLGNKLKDVSDSIYPDDFDLSSFDSESPETESLKSGIAMVFEHFSKLRMQIRLISDEIGAIKDDWEKKKTEISIFKKIKEAQDKYETLRNELSKSGTKDPSEYGMLVQKRHTLEEQLKNNDALKDKIKEIDVQAQLVLVELLKTRRNLTKRRADFLSSVLADNELVGISVVNYGNIDSAEEEIRTTLNSEGKYDKDIGELMKCLKVSNSTMDEAERAIAAIKERILKMRNGDTSLASDIRFINNHLSKLPPENIDRLLCWFPEDSVEVEYTPSPGASRRPIREGSPGQKTAALLAFLLSYGDEPLILDQPEDDLDNHLIYELIVAQLKKAKQKRQVIIVTHNANIVVNGDSENVIALDVRAGQSRIVAQGSLQEMSVREEICRVMEGGKEAFALRYRRINAGA